MYLKATATGLSIGTCTIVPCTTSLFLCFHAAGGETTHRHTSAFQVVVRVRPLSSKVRYGGHPAIAPNVSTSYLFKGFKYGPAFGSLHFCPPLVSLKCGLLVLSYSIYTDSRFGVHRKAPGLDYRNMPALYCGLRPLLTLRARLLCTLLRGLGGGT